ncbi:MAG: hydroxymethylbilane synthase [Chloroflexaceae bacterium]|nr:hydroxymethylbilane synthase [Chloroflexaceae bacterium]
MKLTIGTRGSQLALVQAEYVAATLRQHHPGLEVALQIITTTGDRVLDVALSKVGDKGLFVKEIEVALLDGEVDLAVHSCKDMPSLTPDGLLLAAFPERATPYDALVLPHLDDSDAPLLNDPASNPLDLLPTGATVGTSSLRRTAQLRALRPDLHIRDVRGNVGTRLNKLDSGDYDALILAAAGLERLGMHERVSAYLLPAVMLPAVAQGILAIETRAADAQTRHLLQPLDHPASRVAALAERALLRRLEGGCQVPMAAHAELETDGQHVHLRGLVSSLDGQRVVRGEQRGPADAAETLGTELAEYLLAQGAGAILSEQRGASVP